SFYEERGIRAQMPRRLLKVFFGLILGARLFAGGLSLSSGAASPGSNVALSLNYADTTDGQTQGIEWTLSVPTDGLVSISWTPGDAAVAAGKTLSCNANTCILSGLNSTAIGSGVIAVASISLASTASGNLNAQVSNAIAALADGSGGPIAAT